MKDNSKLYLVMFDVIVEELEFQESLKKHGVNDSELTCDLVWNKAYDEVKVAEDWIDIVSSTIQRCKYDEENKRLYVLFSKSLYVYLNIKPQLFNFFLESKSKGKCIYHLIKDQFPTYKLAEKGNYNNES